MSNPRILIVDDQIHMLQGMSRILRNSGYEVLEASNAMECLNLAAETNPDLILLDVVLPDIDGLEVCRRIKSDPQTKDIYVVLISSINILPENQADGLDQGADSYIVKPISNRELLARIKAMLRLKNAENRLRESEELFRSMFKHHKAVMLLVDPSTGKIVDANHSAETFYGYSASQLCAMNAGQINALPLEEIKTLRGLAAKGERTHFIVPHRLASGEIRTVEAYASPIKQNDRTLLFSIIHDITDRQQAQEMLLQSQVKYRTVADFTYDWECWVDSAGNFLYVSPSCQRITGYSSDEFIADPNLMVRIIHPDDHHMCSFHFEEDRRFETDRICEMDFRIVRRDGQIRWISHKCQPVFDQEGRFIGRRGSNSDITDRKRAEQELIESHERFRNFLNATDDLVFIKDQHSRYLFVNKANQNFFGLSENDIIGKTDLELIPEGLARQCMASDKLAIEKNNLVVLEEHHGDTFFQIRKFPVPVGNDGMGVGGFITDITELKRSEDSKRLLSTAIAQAVEAVIITDANGVIQYVNPAQEIMSGYRRDELIGATPNIFKSDFHDDEFYDKFWKMINNGNAWSGRFINKRKDGATYYEDATISPVYNKSGKLTNFVVVKHDVSKQIKLQEQFLQSQKMEAVGTLAAGVAHDFNNLLQAVLGYCELMLLRKKEDEPDYKDLVKIQQAGRRGADLVKKLMALSHKTETQHKPVDLNREVSASCDLLTRTLPKNIDIKLYLKDSLNFIKADPSNIGQVLMNLSVNARDAMSDGGTLTIQTTDVRLDDDYCYSHPEFEPGEYVLLTVSDTGVGMDQDTVSRIFEPFFTTKARGKGTGLGLATVYSIVKQHGGHITCQSKPNIGTTFNIYFPAIRDDRKTQEQKVDRPIMGGTETILLVDDEEAIRDLITKLLRRFGYDVITASDGKEALDIYQDKGSSISLVLLDLNMPVMDGGQCLSEILKVNPAAKVLLASGYSTIGSTKNFTSEGAKGFVTKPFDTSHLLNKIREVLD